MKMRYVNNTPHIVIVVILGFNLLDGSSLYGQALEALTQWQEGRSMPMR